MFITENETNANAPAADAASAAAAAPAAPVVDTRPPPKSDAEAAIREQEDAAAAEKAKAPTKGKAPEAATGEEGAVDGADADANKPGDDGKPKNRTTAYINRLQTELREAREALAKTNQPPQHAATPQQSTGQATPEASSGAPQSDDPEPTLEGLLYDIPEYTKQYNAWALREAKRADAAEQAATQQRDHQVKLVTSYNERAAAFEAEHPDFKEAVTMIPYELSTEVGLAILAHENGPAIAYYVANNKAEAFTLANTLPKNAAAAIDLIHERMEAAQQASQDPAAAPAAAAAPATPAAKQISKAPAPTPTVGGRSAVQVPPEKQTDDDWYRADKERRRKR